MSTEVLDLSELKPSQSRRLDEIGYEIQDIYQNIIRRLAENSVDDLDWWATHLATRNTDASYLFESLCKLRLVREELQANGSLKQVLTSSKPLKRTLSDFVEQNDVKVEVVLTSRGTFDLSGWLRRLLRLPGFRLLNWPRLVARVFIRWLGAQLTRSGTREGPPESPIIVLDSFLESSSFEGGCFRDRFFPGIEDYLASRERSRLYRIPQYVDIGKDAFNVFRAVREGATRFLIPEDFLQLEDYIEAVTYPIRALRLGDDSPSFEGFDLSVLVRYDLWYSAFSHSSWQALLKYQAIERMAEEELNVKLAVNWYENQVGDKGFNGGFQHHHPDTELVGYQPNFYHHFYFCMRPLAEELEGGFGPDTVAVGGKARLDEPRRYAPDLPTEVAPALRNAGLWRPRRFEPDEEHVTVLAGLPIGAGDSARILACLRGAVSTLEVDGLRLWIKLHPACPREELREALEAPWPVEVEEVAGAFDDVVQRADLFVGSAGGTPVEAMCRGVPSLLVANPRGLTRVGIPDGAPDELWTLCYGPDELGQALRASASRIEDDRAELRRLGERLREDHYEPVTRAGVRRLLRLGEDGGAGADDGHARPGENRR